MSHQSDRQLRQSVPEIPLTMEGHACPACRQPVAEDEVRHPLLALATSTSAPYSICMFCLQGVPRALQDGRYREEWRRHYFKRCRGRSTDL